MIAVRGLVEQSGHRLQAAYQFLRALVPALPHAAEGRTSLSVQPEPSSPDNWPSSIDSPDLVSPDTARRSSATAATSASVTCSSLGIAS